MKVVELAKDGGRDYKLLVSRNKSRSSSETLRRELHE